MLLLVLFQLWFFLHQRVFVTLVSLEVIGPTVVTITLISPDGTTAATESVSTAVTVSVSTAATQYSEYDSHRVGEYSSHPVQYGSH